MTPPIIPELELGKHFLHSIGDKDTLTLQNAVIPFNHLKQQMQQSADGSRRGIVGLKDYIRDLILCVITGEHMLVQGVPGLAKTLGVKHLASRLGLVYRRIQCTPDLIPSDIHYKERLKIDPSTGLQEIKWLPGPAFTNLLLIDEIDRATPKTQAGLLEIMQERTITILGRGNFFSRPRPSDGQEIDEEEQILKNDSFFGDDKIDLKRAEETVFFAFGTQNGMEQEGTYPLPEAQQDRFMLKVHVENPHHDDTKAIAQQAGVSRNGKSAPTRFLDHHLKTLYFLIRIREMLLDDQVIKAFLNSDVGGKVIDLWEFTHLTPPVQGGRYGSQRTAKCEEVWKRVQENKGKNQVHKNVDDLMKRPASHVQRMPRITLGSSPRGLIGLVKASHALALLEGSFKGDKLDVTWEHVSKMAKGVLRHRIKIDHADAHLFSTDHVIDELLNCFK